MQRQISQIPFIFGALFSLVMHLCLTVLAVMFMEITSANVYQKPDIFTVTLEGGSALGGITQVTKNDKKDALKVAGQLPQKTSDEDQKKKEIAEQEAQLKLEKKKFEEKKQQEQKQKELEDKITEQKNFEKKEQEKKELEKKEQEQKEKERKEQEKQLEEEKKKKELEDNKKKIEEERQKKEDEKKKILDEIEKKKKDKAARDKQLQQAIQKYGNSKYTGESSNAGGTGFGAAKVGGKGMGGGTLASAEFVAYRNALEHHIKSGWHWQKSTERLEAIVEINILPNGNLINVKIVQSSGNGQFDDSVLRAVSKAQPVPVPPPSIYETFKVTRFTFNP